MTIDGAKRSDPSVRSYAEALLMVAGSTLVGLAIAPLWGTTPVVLLYVPPVLAAAVWRGLWPALVAAVASTLAYNFFFTAPYRTLLIHSPADAVTVMLLLLVALVTSQLASSMRQHAALAEAHAARNATIAGLARRLLSKAGEAEIAQVAVDELSRLFGCNALLVTGGDHPQLIASAPPEMALNPSDTAAAVLTLGTGEAAGRGVSQANLADWQFHAIASDQEVIAAIGLARNDGMPPVDEDQLALLGNLLDQVALALVRARLEREAREFAAQRERDRIRSALLASIGQDVKPRLTAILGASRALRRAGLSDKTLVSSIASEAAMLARYIDNLVDLGPGSDQEPIEVGPIIIDLYRRSVRRDGVDVHLTPKEYSVLAELAKHAGRVLTHAQLLRAVWGPAQESQIEYLRVAVRALRQKLEADPAHPAIIINEPAVGYRLIGSV
ncbi:MAG: DUF4118 domain-containing protein [Pseudomonadota bacterium]|nr:DUF4118 domain-containing protein [Pseudomonadota bacterium]